MTKILDSYKNKKLEKILEDQKDNITCIEDITGGEDPSMLFYFLADKLGYLLNNDPDSCYSKNGVKNREIANKIIKLLGPLFLKNKQKIEFNSLSDYKKEDSSFIYAMNHGFKDDLLSTALAIPNNAYLMLASLPQFFNTSDGLLSWINGVVLMNRNVPNSKKSSIDKSIKLSEMNVDKIICPEGVWNKSPNQLLLPFWLGTINLSKKTGEKIVPVVHYIEDSLDKDKNIYTIVDNPIDITHLDAFIANDYLRNIIATNYYNLMEKYGKDTRDNLLKDFNTSREYWEDYLKRLSKIPKRYDLKTETSADFRPKSYFSFVNDEVSTIDYPLDMKIVDCVFDDEAFQKSLRDLQYNDDYINSLSKEELEQLKKDMEIYYRISFWENERKKDHNSTVPLVFMYPMSRIEDVYEPLINIKENKNNIQDINYARCLVKEEKLNDFQRRF